jgi:hypothetical protein
MEDGQSNKVETVSFVMTSLTSHLHPGRMRQSSLGIVELILHYVQALRSPSNTERAIEHVACTRVGVREYWSEDSQSKDVTSRGSIQVRREAAVCNKRRKRQKCPRLYAPGPRATRARRLPRRDGGPARSQSHDTRLRKKDEHVHPLIVRAVGGRALPTSARHELSSSLHAACPNARAWPAMYARSASRISMRAKGGSRALRVGQRGRAAGEARLDGEGTEAQEGRARCAEVREAEAREMEAREAASRKAEAWTLRAERHVDAESVKNVSVHCEQEQDATHIVPSSPARA